MVKITVEIKPNGPGQYEVLVHDGIYYGNEPVGVAATREQAQEIRQAYVKGWNDRAWWGSSAEVVEA